MFSEIEKLNLIKKINKKTKIKNNGCHIWTGAKSSSGYGNINYNKKTYKAHRLNFILNKGEIKQGNNICHKCDTPLCINPEHLFQGTQKENVHDCMKKNRGIVNKTHCKNGHEYTENNVKYVKKNKDDKNPYRACKICLKERRRKSDAKRRPRKRGKNA